MCALLLLGLVHRVNMCRPQWFFVPVLSFDIDLIAAPRLTRCLLWPHAYTRTCACARHLLGWNHDCFQARYNAQRVCGTSAPSLKHTFVAHAADPSDAGA